MTRITLAGVLLLAVPGLLSAQSHDAHSAHAGKETREIKALSAEETTALLNGEGNVRVVTDQADAVLAILARRRAGAEPSAAEWEQLFSSEGHRRLRQREESLGRPFADSTFRAFVLAETTVMRHDELARTVDAWRRMDIGGAAARALTYLPRGAVIRARVYPVIKPATNSFVFEVRTDPAIFLYVDPAVSGAKFENTLAHELHHIGYGTVCNSSAALPEPAATLVSWMGAFGEGLAMLAAAGAHDVHPHAVSDSAERARWDADIARADEHFAALEAFFLDVLEGRLTDPERIGERAREFYGEQGPWYTVGWIMGSTVERAFGRPGLLDVICTPVGLIGAYDSALRTEGAGQQPAWSPRLLRALGL